MLRDIFIRHTSNPIIMPIAIETSETKTVSFKPSRRIGIASLKTLLKSIYYNCLT